MESDTDELEAEWMLGAEAASLNASSRTITLKDGRAVQADGVVIATGARAAHAGRAEQRLHPAHAGGCTELAPELVPGSRMAVIGAGFIGSCGGLCFVVKNPFSIFVVC